MQQNAQPTVTLVLGGVRSGKSRYAQRIAERAERVTFIATARRSDGDAEMSLKIERHRVERPAAWVTIEEPLELARAIEAARGGCDVVVIDCLTLFSANVLEACGEDQVAARRAVDDLCNALVAPPCKVILVSNEVGSGVVPAYVSGRRFRDLVGEVNQAVAAVAGTVVMMFAGLPLALKGALESEAPR